MKLQQFGNINYKNIEKMNAGTVIIQADKAYLREFAKEIIVEIKNEFEAKAILQQKERYLSPDQVSEMLSVDKTTLWRWNNRGYLTHSKMGRKNRYKESDVLRILEG